MKGVVASGHPLTSRAASDMFSHGGNAFDAVIAAGFASVVTEPSLTSFGGGGFLLAHSEKEKRDVLFDFFVNTPGLGNSNSTTPDMTAVPIRFPGCTQVFHTGYGSVAVPGMLKGLLHAHDRLCSLPLETILAPALSFLDKGVEVNKRQEIFLGLLKPIMTASDYGREIYLNNGRYAKLGDRIFNPELKIFLQDLIEHNKDFYSGDTAEGLVHDMNRKAGVLSLQDLEMYEVFEREPLRIIYRGREILTNPPPSTGGVLLALGLYLLEKIDMGTLHPESETLLVTLIELMKEMSRFNPQKDSSLIFYPLINSIASPAVESFIKNISEKVPISTRGTTHISVIDEEGNAASMTNSNGSGSGCFIPGTGIMLNNMMGEDDLHPAGFHSSPPGKRVSSMMIPTIVMNNGKVECALGSGGSKRIRTAVLQTLINIIDFSLTLEDAVESPRVHFEDNVVQVEPGYPEHLIEKLRKHYDVNAWSIKDMYFGGVHCVNSLMQGWGDSRRGGSTLRSD
ncbi:MAG: gamma-glutamyltransferase [Nitrospiraceae bacterium]|nr:MAG: gamma-glutamyltransferase [Nitrospiraceae bacterium]